LCLVCRVYTLFLRSSSSSLLFSLSLHGALPICYICGFIAMDKKLEEFFERLRGELADSTTWPSIYLFKFIVPTDPAKIKAVEDAFDQLGAVINTTESRNGKFTSLSVNVQMISPDQVIEKYKEV